MALQSSNEDKKLTSPNIGPTSRTVKQMNNITQLNLLNCDHIEVSQNSNSSIDLECSLFLDETNREFDDYLNTLSPRSSKPPIEDEDFMEDQDFESKTMNNLSKNIKGKFQKVMRRSKKNKFFKSSRPIQGLMSGNEIPVINEAMKKIFKPLNDKPCLKYTPKTMVKTYTNKHKDNSSYVVETFGLPDEPLIPSSNSCAIGKGSIDLDVEMNCNNSRLASPWTVENQANAAEMAIGEDIRRSYSLLEDFSPTILESVEDDFDLEDNIQDIDAENAMREKLSEPQIVLEPIDLSDRLLFKMNKLSPIKNRKELLFERLLNYSENFNSSQNRLSNTKLGKSENILSSNSLTNKKIREKYWRVFHV
ncbi:hypothetical protein HHI36_007231 [Cryptolaemus montrouzieri]|uniref:Uncharacterized protein n=1 Tax=Cryptolaemus montrouzieri TaxID=559131 RepID=A0ABD2MNY2_9CUCU